MDDPRLQGGADHAVQTGGGGVFGVADDGAGELAGNAQLVRHHRLGDAGQHRHGDEQGPGAVGAGQALQGVFHHLHPAAGVEIGHVHVEPGQHRHGLFHGVGNVVELQVQEDPVSPLLDPPHDVRPLGVKKLHADLHKGAGRAEFVQKVKGLLRACEIASHDYVFTHDALLR